MQRYVSTSTHRPSVDPRLGGYCLRAGTQGTCGCRSTRMIRECRCGSRQRTRGEAGSEAELRVYMGPQQRVLIMKLRNRFGSENSLEIGTCDGSCRHSAL
jgi:hypothetical protein